MFDGMTTVINQRTGETEKLSKDGLLNLANAIVKNACDSYMKSNSEIHHRDIERFLKSDYGRVLLRTIDPDKLIYQMKEVMSDGKNQFIDA